MTKRLNIFTHAALMATLVVTSFQISPPTISTGATVTTISPITRTVGFAAGAKTASDPATMAGFAWHTARTASSSIPQPQTRLAWGLAKGFDCTTATWTAATPPNTTTYDRVTYSQTVVNGLTPETAYSYCVKEKDGASSPTTTFTTAKAAPSSFTFLAFADANWRSTTSYQNNYANTVATALRTYPESSFSTHNGETGSATDSTHWDGFLNHSEGILRSQTWLPTALGSGSANRYFALGNALPVSSGTDSTNYSVREGNALLLVINTHRTDTASTNDTVAWIKQQAAELGSAKDSTWIIASVPTQLYGATSSSNTYSNKLKQAFRDSNISLVLQGGAKAYTRSWPIGGAQGTDIWRDYPAKDSISTTDGIVYLTPGASGTQQENVSSAARSMTSGWLSAWTPDLSSTDRLAAGKKSYSAITIAADKISVTAKTVSGNELDHFQINRSQSKPMPLHPYGLNNGFGSDPQTSRTITWLGLNSAKYAKPYFKLALATAAESIAKQTPIVKGCSQYSLPSGLSSYTAYTCQLANLTPGTTYSYRVGAASGILNHPYESPTYSFRTAGNENEFTFLDFADSQSTPVSTYDTYWGNTLRTAIKAHPEASFATHTGDITETYNSANLTAWLSANGTSLSSIAFNPVLGNHDESTTAAPMWDNLFPRQSLTAVPKYSKPSTLQYSYVYQNVLFLHINTNLDTASQLAQTSNWIAATVHDYGKNPDGTNRFIIAIEHKSPFGGAHSGSGSYPTGDFGNPDIVAELPKTFSKLGVDLVLAGHDHNLIRSLPIKWDESKKKATWDRAKKDQNQINSDTDGLVYYIPRNSGQKTYSLISQPSTTSRPWIGFNWRLTQNYGTPDNTVYAVVKVTQSQIEVKSYRTGDASNPIDSFTITQTPR